tara:strand:+ start:994 stop:1443 length:450 start_codon:yes stop_codon:yes gene_type:complete
MPMYNYNCSSCGIIFEELVSGEYYKEPQEHDKCGNLCERTAEDQGIHAHGIGLKEHTRVGSRAKVEHAWMEGEIKNTAKVIKGESGISPYSNYQINHEEAAKQGIAKKVNPKDAKKRRESNAELTQLAASKMSDTDRKRAENGHNTKDN